MAGTFLSWGGPCFSTALASLFFEEEEELFERSFYGITSLSFDSSRSSLGLFYPTNSLGELSLNSGTSGIDSFLNKGR